MIQKKEQIEIEEIDRKEGSQEKKHTTEIIKDKFVLLKSKSEDKNHKINRSGKWSQYEHMKFLEATKKYGNNWHKVRIFELLNKLIFLDTKRS